MAPHVVSPRLGRSPLLVLATLLLAGASVSTAQTDTSTLDAQRNAFKQAYAAARDGGDGWRMLAGGLQNYSLYPYLQATALQHDIQQADLATVQAYLKQYVGTIPADDLRRNFLQQLAQRQDWSSFQTLYQPGLNDALTCDALQAKLASGATLDFDQDLAALWAEPALPSECNPVLSAAHDQGLLADQRLWTRIDNAVSAGKGSTVSLLAGWLPPDDAQSAQHLAQALNDPAAAVSAANHWPDNARSKQAAAVALVRLARRQSDTADSAWQKLQQRFRFSPEQRDQVLNALAVFHATDFDADALTRLANLPASAQTPVSREWRVRAALAEQDWKAVLAAIDAMPEDQRHDDEWRYFRARALIEQAQPDTAQTLYKAVSQQSSYFGFLAADHLGVPYSICTQDASTNSQLERSLLTTPGLQRAFELYAVNLPKLARREWTTALANTDLPTQVQAVQLAYDRGWYDRAVFTLNTGDGLRYYSLRFPLVTQDGVVEQAQQAGIDPAWAYGILRAESAWMIDAQSGADARGLMQLLPGTAAHVARTNGLPWNGGDSLYDPVVNIQLGTRYLGQLAGRFNGAPWLASAAYNAGPARVDQWLQARDTLTPDLFVATIPFKETREYVARVMWFSVIYDWRLHGNAAPIVSRMPAIGQAYVEPNAEAARKTIVCSAPATTVAPASSSAVKPTVVPTKGQGR